MSKTRTGLVHDLNPGLTPNLYFFFPQMILLYPVRSLQYKWQHPVRPLAWHPRSASTGCSRQGVHFSSRQRCWVFIPWRAPCIFQGVGNWCWTVISLDPGSGWWKLPPTANQRTPWERAIQPSAASSWVCLCWVLLGTHCLSADLMGLGGGTDSGSLSHRFVTYIPKSLPNA